MKLAYPQLAQHLIKNLAPIYLVSGDELLLVQEAVDAIRAAATKAGFHERILITAEPHNDWVKLMYTDTHSLSLFSSKKIIELNLSYIKLNSTIGKIFEDYVCQPPSHTLLIMRAAKLEPKIEKTAWYQTLLKNSVVIPIWPIPADQLPLWIKQRAQKNHLQLTPQAAQRLALLVEGNLLAAAQEIEKLSLLKDANKPWDQEEIENAVIDNARFDIFTLVDSALLGDNPRCLRILKNLADEGVEPSLILWALARELRTLTNMKKQIEEGTPLATLFSKAQVWEKRQKGFRAFLTRHTQNQCWQLLTQAAEIDRIIKGIEIGNVWNKLDNFVIQMGT